MHCNCKEHQIKNLLIKKLRESKNHSDNDTIDQYASELLTILKILSPYNVDTDKIVGAINSSHPSSYHEIACELSAAYYFYRKFPRDFQYQVTNTKTISPTKTPKNFDLSFNNNGYKFNVEVKTISRTTTDDNKGIKVFLPTEQRKELYRQGLRFDRNCGPAIGRALMDANNQLVRPQGGLSVMLLCVNDLDVYADAMECFAGQYGILQRPPSGLQAFNKKIIPPLADLQNIDAVVLCNLGFGHTGMSNTELVSSFYGEKESRFSKGDQLWNYEITLPCGFLLRSENVPKTLAQIFKESFFSYTDELSRILKENGNDIQSAIFRLFNMISNKPSINRSTPSEF